MPKLTDEQVSECKEAFMLFDRDGDGCITTAELGTVMRALGRSPTNAEIKQLMKEVDPDGRGMIDQKEFLQVMSKDIKTMDNEKELKTAWAVFDTDKKGVLSAKELQHILGNIGEKLTDQELKDLMKEADPSNTGSIKQADFMRMMLGAK